MMLRRCLWFAWLLCLGCHTLPPLDGGEGDETAAGLWEEGQAAMRLGRPDLAVECYRKSLERDPALTRNHLSLAAAHLERGEEPEACSHLARFLEAHPDRLEVRGRYAELLHRLGRLPEARGEFERFVAEGQEGGDGALNPLVHCHGRLLEIAEANGDAYEAHLHRGIGLYLLARCRALLGEAETDLSAEGLLCKAAAELAAARGLRPDEARPCWYLYAVWRRLAQEQPARRWLREADARAAFSYLTPAEARGLELASRQKEGK